MKATSTTSAAQAEEATSPINLIRNLYEAFQNGDIPYVLQNVHPDMEWHSMGKDGIPYAGDYNSSNLGTFFQRLSELCDINEFQPETFTETGNTVICTGYTSGKARTSGKSFSSKWVMIWEFKDNKPVSFRDYYDTLNLYRALNAL